MGLAIPSAACNAHCHVFGPRARYPFAAGAPYVPAEDAPKERLLEMNDQLGLERCVVVQSTSTVSTTASPKTWSPVRATGESRCCPTTWLTTSCSV